MATTIPAKGMKKFIMPAAVTGTVGVFAYVYFRERNKARRSSEQFRKEDGGIIRSQRGGGMLSRKPGSAGASTEVASELNSHDLVKDRIRYAIEQGTIKRTRDHKENE